MKKPLGRSSWPGVAHRLAPADVDPDLEEKIRFRRVLAATVKGCVDGIAVWCGGRSDDVKAESEEIYQFRFISCFDFGLFSGLIDLKTKLIDKSFCMFGK